MAKRTQSGGRQARKNILSKDNLQTIKRQIKIDTCQFKNRHKTTWQKLTK